MVRGPYRDRGWVAVRFHTRPVAGVPEQLPRGLVLGRAGKGPDEVGVERVDEVIADGRIGRCGHGTEAVKLYSLCGSAKSAGQASPRRCLEGESRRVRSSAGAGVASCAEFRAGCVSAEAQRDEWT